MLSLAAISISGMLLASGVSPDSYNKQQNRCFFNAYEMRYTNRKESFYFRSDMEIDAILNQFDSIDEPFSVQQYLSENPDILDLLTQSIIEFKKYYSTNTAYSISLLDNSEEDEQSQIRIVAQSQEPISSLFERLNRFFDFWWIHRVQKSDGKIVFGIS